ncbi:MAG: response regulator, partial [Lachnospiraceae bacterium]|nr:response regulator [Lachnospiraceae bacterium]
MYRIVMVDDDPFSLHMLSKILENEYELKNFTSGNQLLSYLQKDTADMILLDYLMPEKDGIEVLAEMRKNPKTASIPVVILTADQNVSLEITCFKNGAEDFITKPFSPEVVRSRIKRILDLKKLRENLQFRLDEKTRQMENVMLQAFTTVANIVDAKDDFTEEHSVHVAEYAARIAKELGWSDKEVYNIYYTGLL